MKKESDISLFEDPYTSVNFKTLYYRQSKISLAYTTILKLDDDRLFSYILSL